MLALIYLSLAVYLGDHLCRRFYRFVSVPHRLAAAFLVGLLASSWFTYLAARLFARTSNPMLWGNIAFFIIAAGAIFWLTRKAAPADMIKPRANGSDVWDWATLAALFLGICCLLVGTLNSHGGRVRISGMEYSDFAPASAISQSFALGHNFPTQYPHYAGEPIHYHFLFYFQAGNLEFLGLNLAWAVNVMSVLGLVSMLALLMALGELLFGSRVPGRIGAALFFFHGSPMFISFLRSQTSVKGALHAIVHLSNFLPSGYPYRGETWGIWSQIVFVNQRHLPSAIGILLIVLVFLIDRYRQAESPARVDSDVDADANLFSTNTSIAAHMTAESHTRLALLPKLVRINKDTVLSSKRFVFSGFLLGALPLWHTAVFTAAAAVLLSLLVLFPFRRQMVGLGVTAAVVGLPQILFLRSGEMAPAQHALIHWGFIVDNPTVLKVVTYVAFTFGLKWPVIILALIASSWFQRRFFIALCSLFLLTFCTQLSVEVLANHKFLNIWLIVANLFAGYGLWWLWKIKIPPVAGPAMVIILTLCIIAGGVIDLFPIYNSSRAELDYKTDPVVDWVRSNTKRDAVFLSNIVVNHPILLAGRKVFYGWPYYTWSAGYNLAKREPAYRQMFESRNLEQVFRLLKQNNISYVAFDDGVRHGEVIKRPNEQLYARHFENVFEDKKNQYGSLKIYKVPDSLPPGAETANPAPAVTVFEGGKGTGKGEFDTPLGLTLDRQGNIFVADTNNGRIQKFSSTGTYITSIGRKGSGEGELGEPNGIAIDRFGNIYVAESSNQRLQKLKPDGTFIAQWTGPEPRFYGPRKIAIGPDDSIYVVDQGRTRIVKFSPDGQVLANWGRKGTGDGEFDDPTSVAVDPTNNKVYVADPCNKRIQVFDSNGKFVGKWSVDDWQRRYGFEDLTIDAKLSRLYASSANMDAVLVFNLNGTQIGRLRPAPPDKLEGASALALADRKLYVLCMFGNRVSQIALETR
jgi:DNA-binding beta-propeller fold protein YncE